jgi:predicted transcriptional regulator
MDLQIGKQFAHDQTLEAGLCETRRGELETTTVVQQWILQLVQNTCET